MQLFLGIFISSFSKLRQGLIKGSEPKELIMFDYLTETVVRFYKNYFPSTKKSKQDEILNQPSDYLDHIDHFELRSNKLILYLLEKCETTQEMNRILTKIISQIKK